ncbi:hypothetical protein ACFSM5_14695 [Lacibacterium aquatile]|uniref:Porin n=1 Tax=Lacibacterium aquatile TaxID=1168082 RepID=A0ABW5DSS5_9PROT
MARIRVVKGSPLGNSLISPPDAAPAPAFGRGGWLLPLAVLLAGLLSVPDSVQAQAGSKMRVSVPIGDEDEDGDDPAAMGEDDEEEDEEEPGVPAMPSVELPSEFDPLRREKLAHRLDKAYRQALLQYQQVQALKRDLNSPVPTGLLAAEVPTGNTEGEDDASLMESEKLEVSIGGQINRALIFGRSGSSKQLSNVDSGASPSRLNVSAKYGSPRNVQIGGAMELALASNGGGSVDFGDEVTANSSAISLRQADLFLRADPYGKLSVGQGSMAGDGVSEIDLSGSSGAIWAGVQHVGGGFSFGGEAPFYPVGTDAAKAQGVAPTIGDMINHYDGLGRLDRIRYDTAAFKGFSLSASYGENASYDVALRYKGKIARYQIAAGAAFSENTRAAQRNLDGAVTNGDLIRQQQFFNAGFSVLAPFGVSMTGVYGRGITEFARLDNSAATRNEIRMLNERNDQFFYGKLGYSASWFDFGKTSFAIDAALHDERRQTGERAYAYGVGAVQRMDDWGAEFYISARMFHISLPKEDALVGGGSRSNAIYSYVNSDRALGAMDMPYRDGLAGSLDPVLVLFTGVKVKL